LAAGCAYVQGKRRRVSGLAEKEKVALLDLGHLDSIRKETYQNALFSRPCQGGQREKVRVPATSCPSMTADARPSLVPLQLTVDRECRLAGASPALLAALKRN
jgi:hypothetical protein